MSTTTSYSRCSVCNATNDPNIATNAEDYTPRRSFDVDPLDDTLVICSECDFYIEDDVGFIDDDDFQFLQGDF